MSSHRLVAVSAVGPDRPGIVAGVTRALYEANCNLADVTSTLLSGHFAMLLIVRAPAELSPQALEDALAGVAAELGLTITVRPVEEGARAPAEPTHMVSVYGADRPGIVYRVAEVLAAEGANITDLTSRLIGEPERPVYALMLEVALRAEARVEERLRALGAELGVEVSMHPLEADVL
jgi:glycine cleavage system transcriptional repressor